MRKSIQFDPMLLLGLAIAAAGILGGLVLESGQLRDVGQITAALIVFGGTFGAVMVSTPRSVLLRAIRRSRSLFWTTNENTAAVLEELIRFGATARRAGVAALEPEAREAADPFLRKAMTLLADGFNAEEIRGVLDIELIVSERETESEARVFESAGGYAPTIGIIGAVLGLIQVMKHLNSIDDVGRGIAVAFVATLYGVGLANLVLLPIGAKIRNQARTATHMQEMIIEGTVAIQEGKNPRLIREMLLPFVTDAISKHGRERAAKPSLAYQRQRAS